jgi:hypothetical protein
LSASKGGDFHKGFSPHFSPENILELGVFEGKYLNDCQDEFPEEWFTRAKLSAQPDPHVNFFGLKSRQSLATWKGNGWIHGPDPRGWFQWFCRYWLGRRLPEVDAVQIRRWRSFRRHEGQVRANCADRGRGRLFCSGLIIRLSSGWVIQKELSFVI